MALESALTMATMADLLNESSRIQWQMKDNGLPTAVLGRITNTVLRSDEYAS